MLWRTNRKHTRMQTYHGFRLKRTDFSFRSLQASAAIIRVYGVECAFSKILLFEMQAHKHTHTHTLTVANGCRWEDTRRQIYIDAMRCIWYACFVLFALQLKPCIPFFFLFVWTFFVHISCNFRQKKNKQNGINLYAKHIGGIERTGVKVHRTLYRWLEPKWNYETQHQRTMPLTKTMNAHSHSTLARMHWPTTGRKEVEKKKLRVELKRCYCLSQKKVLKIRCNSRSNYSSHSIWTHFGHSVFYRRPIRRA